MNSFTENNENYPQVNCISSLYIKNQKLKSLIQDKMEILKNQMSTYQQIIYLLFNNIGVHSKENFDKNLQSKLYKSCQGENIKFVDLLTRKKAKQNNLTFVLFDEDSTAAVLLKNTNQENITIPTTIKKDSKIYTVTRIIERAFENSKDLKTVEFESDSQMRFIERKAFSNSSLEKIKIPQKVERIEEGAFQKCEKLETVGIETNSLLEMIGKRSFYWLTLKNFSMPSNVKIIEDETFSINIELKYFHIPENTELKSIGKTAFGGSCMTDITLPSDIELKEGWCDGLEKVKKITVVQKEKQNILFFENKFLLGKSDVNSEIFDVLILARRDIKEAIIPNFIQRIESYAFANCEELESVEFESNSNLKSIGQFLFITSSVVTFTIPSSLEKMDDKWCAASYLKNIILSPNNPNFIYFDDKYILGKSDNNSTVYDKFLFARRNIKKATIPSFIKIISPYAFHLCSELKEIEFSESSQLERIEDSAFILSAVESITFPSSLKYIHENAFCLCNNLRKVEFLNDSKLVSIGYKTFLGTKIDTLIIPSSVVELKRSWFCDCDKLINIKVVECENQNISYFDNKYIIGKSCIINNFYDTLVMARKDLVVANIPSFIKRIESCAFNNCTRLKFVEFQNNSNLKFIAKNSFQDSNISCFQIPPSVNRIENRAFSCCYKLKIIEICENSELYLVDVTGCDNQKKQNDNQKKKALNFIEFF